MQRLSFFLLISAAIVMLAGNGARGQDAQAEAAAPDAAEQAAPAVEPREDAGPAEEDEGPESEAAEPAPPPLSSEMAAFRDQVRRTLAQVYSRRPSAQSYLPAEVVAFSLAFGHTAEIDAGGRNRQRLNAVGALCWNYPCAGYRLLRTDGERILARVGYGYQQRPGQLLAMLAQNRVPADYEIRVGDHHGTVADLASAEKLACRSGLDMSAALIGLASYTDPGDSWKSETGEAWTVERLLEEELDREVVPDNPGVVHRLMAISYAAQRLEKQEAADSALLERARAHVEEFQDYALEMQNDDGTWHPKFFAFRGTSKDGDGVLRSTGGILAWLVFSLPEDRLEDSRLVRGLGYLNRQLAYRTNRRSAIGSSTLEVEGIMNAARALTLYDTRYFKPRTPESAEEDTSAQSAKSPSRSANPRSAYRRR